jgi:hypothetical protein
MLLQGCKKAWAVVQPLLNESKVKKGQLLAQEHARQLAVGAASACPVPPAPEHIWPMPAPLAGGQEGCS